MADPARQAYRVLRIAFTIIPIVAGIDQFLNKLADWSMYLAPVATRLAPISAQHIMMIGGVVEVIAGLLVAVRPRIGAWAVAIWLWLIIINLLAAASFYDTALRDFGLSLAAVALARLAVVFDRRAPDAL
jgi:uncharacterized membrane protein HdeD (DUF308 family)